MRERLVCEIELNPGRTSYQLAKALEIHLTTAQYHLRKLLGDRRVVLRHDGRVNRVFLEGQEVPKLKLEEWAVLHNPRWREIIDATRELDDPFPKPVLYEELSIPRSTLTYGVEKMVDLEVLDSVPANVPINRYSKGARYRPVLDALEEVEE